MGKKGKKTRWRSLPIGGTDKESGLSLEAAPPTTDANRITFNEDEYTKITTPRQDVLFKKGYLGRKRAGTVQSPTDCQDMHSTDSVESESYVSEEAQYVYPTGYMDPSGVYYVNGNTFETYDPYTGTVTVVVGPPTQYPPGPPVLAALPCQPVPLQPVEWFNPPAPWCYSYNRRKRYSTDSQNCSAQSSESTGPPGSPQEPVDEGACANAAVYSPQYVYPGYMFGPPVYTMNGMTVQGMIPPPAPVTTDPSAGKRRKKRRRRRRGGVTDDGSESSCCEEVDMPGCQSGASSDVVCQSGASSDAGSKGNSDSGVHTDPTPSPPPVLHDEEHILHTSHMQECRGLPTMLPMTQELIQIQDCRASLINQESVQIQECRMAPTIQELAQIQDCRTVPTTREYSHIQDCRAVPTTQECFHTQDSRLVSPTQEPAQVQDCRTIQAAQEFTQIQDSRLVPTTQEFTPNKDSMSVLTHQESAQNEDCRTITTAQESTEIQNSNALPSQETLKTQESSVSLSNQEVITEIASRETSQYTIKSPSESGVSTPDELSIGEDDVTPNLCPTAQECSSQESTLGCLSSPSATKDLVTNDSDLSFEDTSPEENFESCHSSKDAAEVLQDHHSDVPPSTERSPPLLPLTPSDPEPLILDKKNTDLKVAYEGDSNINIENTKEVLIEGLCEDIANTGINSLIPSSFIEPEYAQCALVSESNPSFQMDNNIRIEVESTEESKKEFVEEKLIEDLDELKIKVQEKAVVEFECHAVNMNTELVNESCSRFDTGKTPVPPPRRKKSLCRAAEKLATRIVEDAIREGVEEVSHTRLANPLSITEAVTKWLHSQDSSPLTCPVSESDSEEDEEEVEEEGTTGQKNVRGNPFLAPSRSGAGQRVANGKDCVSIGSSTTEWDFSHARDMCDPARSVDKYYRLAADTEEGMGERKPPSVYKTAMHIRHNGPFPCGVCCIIQ